MKNTSSLEKSYDKVADSASLSLQVIHQRTMSLQARMESPIRPTNPQELARKSPKSARQNPFDNKTSCGIMQQDTGILAKIDVLAILKTLNPSVLIMFSGVWLMDVHNVFWGGYDSDFFYGYSCSEIEAILLNRRNRAELINDEDTIGPCGVTYGVTSTGERIGVIWEAECGNPLHIRPVKVIKSP
jgi:hypothetical protein